MATITAEGLVQENRILSRLCTDYSVTLTPRGINPEKINEYAGSIRKLEDCGATVIALQSRKEELTKQEAGARKKVHQIVQRFQSGAKNTFAAGNSVLKQFHIGDTARESTSQMEMWGSDILKAYEANKDKMSGGGGILQIDVDELTTSLAELKSIDTEQENLKTKAAPEATAAFNAAMNEVKAYADQIYNTAAIVYKEKPEVWHQFEQTKKLRYEAPAHKDKPGDSGTGSGGTTPPTPTAPSA
jgi:hypothetical protein